MVENSKYPVGKIIAKTQVLHGDLTVPVDLLGTPQPVNAYDVIEASLTNEIILANSVRVSRYARRQRANEATLVTIKLPLPEGVTRMTVTTGHEKTRQRY